MQKKKLCWKTSTHTLRDKQKKKNWGWMGKKNKKK